VSYANRGKGLEYMVSWACVQYGLMDIARIDKIPTPIKILGIAKGYVRGCLEKKSTVDYTGVLADGKFVAFDCKETHEDRFKLSDLQPHQYDYLEQVNRLGGYAFLVIEYVKQDLVCRVPFAVIKEHMDNRKIRGMASIKFTDVEVYRVKSTTRFALDFLQGMY